MQKMPRIFLLVASAVTVGSVLLTGCSGTDSESGAEAIRDPDAVKVVATTTQVCDYVTQLATDGQVGKQLSFTKIDPSGRESHAGVAVNTASTKLTLTCLLASNASAHEHEMTPQQMTALANANLFLVNGVDLEHFLSDAVKSSGFKGVMGVTSGVLSASDLDQSPEELAKKEASLPYKVYRGVEQVKVMAWPFPPEHPGEAEEFRYDPHVWSSPRTAEIQVRNIGAALALVAPSTKSLFSPQVTSYVKQLQALDTWITESLESVPPQQRILFSSHETFGYFARDYGIKYIGAAIPDFNGRQDASASYIRAEAKKVKESGATVIFAEESNDPKSIEAIARAAGVRVIMGEYALYGDSLGPAGSAGDTYIGSQLHNVSTMVTAWGGTLVPLPEVLQPYARSLSADK